MTWRKAGDWVSSGRISLPSPGPLDDLEVDEVDEVGEEDWRSMWRRQSPHWKFVNARSSNIWVEVVLLRAGMDLSENWGPRQRSMSK